MSKLRKAETIQADASSQCKSAPVYPGQTIGIIGGGQLGRMTAMAAKSMGYRIAILEPQADCPAASVSDERIQAAYDDPSALRQLAEVADVVTVEFENIPSPALDAVASHVPVRPSAHVLHICQNRRREKEFLRENGVPCAAFRVVREAHELHAAVAELGLPAVLKTADFGYDGKGQTILRTNEEVEKTAAALTGQTWVLEEFVTYQCEISAICARNPAGETRVFPIAENEHRNHILHRSIVPARASEAVALEASRLAVQIAEALEVVGLIAVEFFLRPDSSLLVNELAPRPHNSGHYSMDACLTGQFEQHVRAVCGLPLGDTDLLSPVVMVNLLGDLWGNKAPDWGRLLRNRQAKLHLYGKREARRGRKMGHFNILDADVANAAAKAEALWLELRE